MRRARPAARSSLPAQRRRAPLGAGRALAAAAIVALAAAPAASAPGPAGVEVTPAPGAALHDQILDKGREIRQAQADRRRVRARLADRIVDLYRTDPPGALELVLTSESLSGAMETYRLLERISGHDAGLAAAVDGAAARVARLRAERVALKQAWRDRLAAIAHCESRGRPDAISPGGAYRGKYQFDMKTWRAVGGRGDPAAAPEAVQDRLAAKLYRQRGPQPWPVCGPSAG